MKKYEIINKFRFMTFLTILVMTLIFLINLIFVSKKVYGLKIVYKTICIEENDTLFDIALDYGAKNKSTRTNIKEIRELNNLGYKYVQKGDLIKVPIK